MSQVRDEFAASAYIGLRECVCAPWRSKPGRPGLVSCPFHPECQPFYSVCYRGHPALLIYTTRCRTDKTRGHAHLAERDDTWLKSRVSSAASPVVERDVRRASSLADDKPAFGVPEARSGTCSSLQPAFVTESFNNQSWKGIHLDASVVGQVLRGAYQLSRESMRTRRTTALSDDNHEVDVIPAPKAKSKIRKTSKADRSSSGHHSDAAATGNKEEQKAAKAMKRRERDAEETKELDTAILIGRKRRKSEIAEQQTKKAKGPAAFRKQKRSSAVAQEEQPSVRLIQQLGTTAQNGQATFQQTAEIGGEPAAMKNDATEAPEENEDDDAPEEVGPLLQWSH